VLNKIDLLPEEERAALLSRTNSGPKGKSDPNGTAAAALSALTGEGWMICSRPSMRRFTPIPSWKRSCAFRSMRARILAAIEAGMIVHTREYEGNRTISAFDFPASTSFVFIR
jgi:hypothetical protein